MAPRSRLRRTWVYVSVSLTGLAAGTVVILQAASYAIGPDSHWTLTFPGGYPADVHCEPGRLVVEIAYTDPDWATTWSTHVLPGLTIERSIAGTGDSSLGALFQGLQHFARTGQKAWLTLSIAPWLLFAVLVPYPTIMLMRGPLRRRRIRRNRCARCGYPPMGLPEKRCPKCEERST